MVEVYSGIVLLGSTIRLRSVMKDFDGSPLTPDTKEIKIYDAEGTLKGTILDADIYLESEGVYYADFVVPNPSHGGKWRAVWTVVKNSKPDIDYIEFEVREVL